MPATVPIDDQLVLDGRLALYHQSDHWLALADLHYGYESSRRREGALWPNWGMETVAARLEALVDDYRPDTLVLVGDVVDSSAASEEAIPWLRSVAALGPRLILVEGNHDRGPVKREFDWVASYRIGDHYFEHGHLDLDLAARELAGGAGATRVRGHLHPSMRYRDGAGTCLRLPTLVLETSLTPGHRDLILPAFSPWAGGAHLEATPGATTRQWVCSPGRVFEIA